MAARSSRRPALAPLAARPESTSIAARPDADAGRCLGVARAGLEPARSRAPSLAIDASLRTRLATALAARGEAALGASREQLRAAHPGRRVPPLGGRRRSSPSRGRRPAGGPFGPADAADLARVSRLVARVERAASAALLEEGAPPRGPPPPALAEAGARADATSSRADAEGLRRWFEAARAALDDDDEKRDENGPTAKRLTGETNPESETTKPDDGRFYSPSGRGEKKRNALITRAPSADASDSRSSDAARLDASLWLHAVCFEELRRQIATSCRERGALLAKVWASRQDVADADRARALRDAETARGEETKRLASERESMERKLSDARSTNARLALRVDAVEKRRDEALRQAEDAAGRARDAGRRAAEAAERRKDAETKKSVAEARGRDANARADGGEKRAAEAVREAKTLKDALEASETRLAEVEKALERSEASRKALADAREKDHATLAGALCERATLAEEVRAKSERLESVERRVDAIESARSDAELKLAESRATIEAMKEAIARARGAERTRLAEARKASDERFARVTDETRRERDRRAEAEADAARLGERLGESLRRVRELEARGAEERERLAAVYSRLNEIRRDVRETEAFAEEGGGGERGCEQKTGVEAEGDKTATGDEETIGGEEETTGGEETIGGEEKPPEVKPQPPPHPPDDFGSLARSLARVRSILSRTRSDATEARRRSEAARVRSEEALRARRRADDRAAEAKTEALTWRQNASDAESKRLEAHARAERLEGERLVSDETREDALRTRDALAAKVRTLEADVQALRAAQKSGERALRAAKNRLASERESTEALERSAAEATRRAVDAEARRVALERTRSDAESKAALLRAECDALQTLRAESDALRSALARDASDASATLRATRETFRVETARRDAAIASLRSKSDALAEALRERPTRSALRKWRLRASLLATRCRDVIEKCERNEQNALVSELDTLRLCRTREQAVRGLVRDAERTLREEFRVGFCEKLRRVREDMSTPARSEAARALARLARPDVRETIRRVRSPPEKKDAAAQCDDAEVAGWVRRARSAPRLDQDDERLVSAEACAWVIAEALGIRARRVREEADERRAKVIGASSASRPPRKKAFYAEKDDVSSDERDADERDADERDGDDREADERDASSAYSSSAYSSSASYARSPFACLEGACVALGVDVDLCLASIKTHAAGRGRHVGAAAGVCEAFAPLVATAPGEAYESGDAGRRFARNAIAVARVFFPGSGSGGGDDGGAPLLLRGHARKEDEGRGGFGRGGPRERVHAAVLAAMRGDAETSESESFDESSHYYR